MFKYFIKNWYKPPNFLSYLLFPFSAIYCLIINLRHLLYAWGLKKTYVLKVPVIVVGNLTVGGNGKSPLVIALAKHFKAQGIKVGIVTRGYKGRAKSWPQVVNADSDPIEVGDEAVMMAAQAEVPVVVAPNRVLAAQQLIQDFASELIISDDGLQHEALGRNLEIAVVDAQHRLGNGFCLPAGPLRESAKRLQRVDYVVVNGGVAKDHEFQMRLLPDLIYNLANPKQLWTLPLTQAVTVHAVAGIGFPQRFFDSLKQLGFICIPHEFPDHHQFTANDIDFSDFPIIMTAKDAVKCKAFADQRHWCLTVRAEVDGDLFKEVVGWRQALLRPTNIA